MFISRFCAAVTGVMLLAPFFAYSGTLDSPAAPTGTSSAMYTLSDIYNRLDTGSATAKRTGAFSEPTAGPTAGTGRTLDEVMSKAPSKDDTNGASASHVLFGKTFWGLTSAGWGTQTGSIATQTLSSGATTVSVGYYAATDLATVDTDLAAGNIGTGTTIFGIAGTAVPAPVENTGQTISYSATGGEDGDLEKGVSWPSPRFTDNGNGAVTDNLTGLIWLKNANVSNDWRTWSQSLADVAELNSSGTMNGNSAGDISNGGSHQTDWRLPNVRELQSLIHYGVDSPSLPNTAGTGKWTSGAPFTNVLNTNYWPGTTSMPQRAERGMWCWTTAPWNKTLRPTHIVCGRCAEDNR